MQHSSLLHLLAMAGVALLLAGCQSLTGNPELTLAADRQTHYQIRTGEAASPVDIYAAEQLAGYLEQMTGATFPVINGGDWDAAQPTIHIGVSEAVKALLDHAHPLDSLDEQAYVVRSHGSQILLYGEGVHGNLHATIDFLEGLGWRWYSVFEEPAIPVRPTLKVPAVHRQGDFDFAYRLFPTRYGVDFYLQNYVNQGYERDARRLGRAKADHLVSYLAHESWVHTAFRYIPPAPDVKYADSYDWLEKRNYFETHPWFFSLNEAGQRTTRLQLCFSNRGLRDEFTRNVMLHLKHGGTDQFITVDAADHPGAFCHCADCKALEAKYQSPGGPLYDYLIEICGIMQETHPEVYIKTLAYRRTQTQKPPVLPEGERLPDNLIIDFAPIEDNYLGDWSSPDPRLQETLQDLRDWGKIAHHLWAWIYPNPWGTGKFMPVGNVDRLVTNFRLMHEAGVTGIFADHNGYLSRSGWSELQAYLMFRLSKDIDADVDAIITEFTEHQYGPAAPLVRDYLDELEQHRRAIPELSPSTTYKSSRYDEATFPYITAQNIHRWQQQFEQMLRLTDGDEVRTYNLQLLRRELDMATLWKWFDLRDLAPETYTDAKVLEARIKAADNRETLVGQKLARTIQGSHLDNFMMMIAGGGREKPLPPRFAEIDPSKIRTFPLGRGKKVLDPEGAFGFATIVDSPDYPFVYGFFQWRSRSPRVVIPGPRVKLEKADITPDQYALYEIGTIEIEVRDSLIHMGRSWYSHLEVGELLFEPGERNEYKAWLSLKFEGPTYGGSGEEDRVLCDRIILVRQDDVLGQDEVLGQ